MWPSSGLKDLDQMTKKVASVWTKVDLGGKLADICLVITYSSKTNGAKFSVNVSSVQKNLVVHT